MHRYKIIAVSALTCAIAVMSGQAIVSARGWGNTNRDNGPKLTAFSLNFARRIGGTEAANLIGRFARIVDGSVSSISGSTLTVTKDGASYTVDASSAKIRARFWGSLGLSDIVVNDQVSVWGTWTDNNKTSLKARLIRDLSIQRRHATFFGHVTAISGNTISVNTLRRGAQTVTYISGPVVDRRQQTIALSAVSVGNLLRVRGIWDMKANTVTVDTSMMRNAQIKDFTLPPRPSPSPAS